MYLKSSECPGYSWGSPHQILSAALFLLCLYPGLFLSFFCVALFSGSLFLMGKMTSNFRFTQP